MEMRRTNVDIKLIMDAIEKEKKHLKQASEAGNPMPECPGFLGKTLDENLCKGVYNAMDEPNGIDEEFDSATVRTKNINARIKALRLESLIIPQWDIRSHRPILGFFSVGIKKLLRRMLTPFIAPSWEMQSQVNTQLCDLIELLMHEMTERVQILRSEKEAMKHAIGNEMGEQIRILRNEKDFLEQTLKREMEDRIQALNQASNERLTAMENYLWHNDLLDRIFKDSVERIEMMENNIRNNNALLEQLKNDSNRLLNLEENIRSDSNRLLNLEENIRNNNALLEQLKSDSQRIINLEEHTQSNSISLESMKPELKNAMNGMIFASERLRRMDRYLRDKGVDALNSASSFPAVSLNEATSSAIPREGDFDYYMFEHLYRGSEEDIKKRQSIYLPYLDGIDEILDIGCGRGEFLELLREKDFQARGIDISRDMILRCREKGLNVEQEDLFEALPAIEDASLGCIFAAQLIEHLSPEQIRWLVRISVQKICYGGLLILETQNPRCLSVFSNAFYLDPSHIRPVHPLTMDFLLREEGLKEVNIIGLSPYPQEMLIPALDGGSSVVSFNKAMDRLNSLLFGYQDYAVIGYRR